MAVSEVARDLLGVREMLSEINMAPDLPMLMHMDNQAAIKHLEGEASSIKTKHIDVPIKFVCDYARRVLVLCRCQEDATVTRLVFYEVDQEDATVNRLVVYGFDQVVITEPIGWRHWTLQVRANNAADSIDRRVLTRVLR